MIHPAADEPSDLVQRLQHAIEQQREVTRLIREQAEQGHDSPAQLRARRRAAWADLRGTVTYRGDIVAPLGVKWDAAE
ncbi:MAG: hypothetical protein AAF800_06225 [Planctomycetota bacterium]